MVAAPGRAGGGHGRVHVINGSHRPGRVRRAPLTQLAQMFWVAVRAEMLGDGVGVADWGVLAAWAVVP